MLTSSQRVAYDFMDTVETFWDETSVPSHVSEIWREPKVLKKRNSDIYNFIKYSELKNSNLHLSLSMPDHEQGSINVET